jgi:hypothetical protein
VRWPAPWKQRLLADVGGSLASWLLIWLIGFAGDGLRRTRVSGDQ